MQKNVCNLFNMHAIAYPMTRASNVLPAHKMVFSLFTINMRCFSHIRWTNASNRSTQPSTGRTISLFPAEFYATCSWFYSISWSLVISTQMHSFRTPPATSSSLSRACKVVVVMARMCVAPFSMKKNLVGTPTAAEARFNRNHLQGIDVLYD